MKRNYYFDGIALQIAKNENINYSNYWIFGSPYNAVGKCDNLEEGKYHIYGYWFDSNTYEDLTSDEGISTYFDKYIIFSI